MLDGITVLHTYETINGIEAVIGVWLAFILLTAFAIYAWILWTNRRTKAHFIVTIIVTLLCIISLFGTFSIHTTKDTYYKVLIGPEVSYRDFAANYEVIEIEGEIYTIRKITNGIMPTITEPTIPTETWYPDAVG